MKHVTSIAVLSIGIIVMGGAIAAQPTPAGQAAQSVDSARARALGKWRSVEQFEGEPRITVALRGKDREVEGWAVMLGQQRKGDERATVAMSFCSVAWAGERVLFLTIMPDDEGTVGWELRLTSQTTAVLKMLTEDGKPLPVDMQWEMTREKTASVPEQEAPALSLARWE